MRIFLKIIWYEWKIQCSQRSNWLLCCFYLAIFWLNFSIHELPIHTVVDFSTKTAQGLGLFGSLFTAVISVYHFRREVQPGFAYFWGRLLSSTYYPWVKLTASILVQFTALLPTLACFSGLLWLTFGAEAAPIGLSIFMWLITPTIFFTLSISFLISILVRKSIHALFILITGFISYFSLQLDISQPLSFAPYSIYTSALIGFGPDASFVFLNRILYLCLGLLVCLMGSFLANVLLPVCYRFKFSRLNVSLIIFSFALAIGSILMAIQYQEISHLANSLPDPLRHAQQRVVCQDIETYTAEITLDATGRISAGNAIIRFNNKQARDSIPLTLNAGLKRMEPQYIENGQLISDKKSGYSSAQEMQIQYSGRMIIPRYSYSYYHQEPSIKALGLEPGFFANANFALILGKGTWHPISECAPNSIMITIPNSFPVVYTSADTITSGIDSSIYTWEHREDGVLLVAGNYSQYKENNGWMVFLPDQLMSTDKEEKLVNLYSSVLDVGSSFLSIAPFNQGKIVMVPLIQQSYWQTTDQSIFIPERLVFASKLLGTSNENLIEQSLNITTLVAQDVLIAWWCEDRNCPDLYGTLIAGQSEYSINPENYSSAPFLFYSALRLSREMGQQIDMDAVLRFFSDAAGNPLQMVMLPIILPEESIELVPRIGRIGEDLCYHEFGRLLSESRELSRKDTISFIGIKQLANTISSNDFLCTQSGEP